MPTRQSVIRKRYAREIENLGAVTCGICGFPIIRMSDLTVDHIIPKVMGGKDAAHNFQPAHFVCNQRKGNQLGYKETTEIKK